jgi:hypothetical protein
LIKKKNDGSGLDFSIDKSLEYYWQSDIEQWLALFSGQQMSKMCHLTDKKGAWGFSPQAPFS